ncbi:copper chaperone PCu(A)C [Qipengyuania marisflavi]|uniref:Copper chaperone PCu(A)C n=1 Tax=Qipengyuania marisflavi TaxID=2486356 RepID=A0A5S3P8Y3_9SPHN|nr:copper chaperone PCu(A)C [Qipengyuania marisflavi]TMM49898.1 copper chaperone PCu(A)C [Qipengyuania marisflavi]
MIKPIYAAALLTATSLGLASCGGEAEQPAGAEAPEGVPGLAIENARLILPAVEGNPGIVYFDLVNSGEKARAVRRADVMGAERTEMHASMEMSGEMTMGETGPQTVQPGDTMTFEPGGLHLMVFDISPELTAGSKASVTLTVAGGDKTSFEAEVRAAGDDR